MQKMKSLVCLIFSFTTILIWTGHLDAQEKINLTAGIGIPDLLNVGMSYEIRQTQVGFSIGSMPSGSEESIFALSGDFYYHFAGTSKLSERRPWYGRFGLVYLRDKTNSQIDKYTYLNTRIGRDLNISKSIRIALDAGLVFQLHHTEIEKKDSSGWNFDLDFPLMPSIGIKLFFRL